MSSPESASARLVALALRLRDLWRCVDERALCAEALRLLAEFLGAQGGSVFVASSDGLARAASLRPEHPVFFVGWPPAADSPLAAIAGDVAGSVVIADAAGQAGTPWADCRSGSVLVLSCREKGEPLHAVVSVYDLDAASVEPEHEQQGLLVAAHLSGALLAARDSAQLRVTEHNLRQLVEHGLTGICVFQDERAVYANPKMAELLGLSPQEARSIVGRGYLDFVHPDDRQAIRRNASRRLRGEVLPDRYEMRLQRLDGGIAWVEVLVTVIRHEERPALLVHAVDIAARKRAQAERAQMEERFLHAQKMEAIGRLAGGVAHDFNNLLMAISGHTELLARRLPEQHQKHLDHIRQAAELAAGLTRQLLAFSRRQVVQAEIVSLNDVVSSTHKLLRRIIGEDVSLELRLAPEVPAVRADPSLISQVLMNLAVNARDAMPDGGVLTIETAAELVDRDAGVVPHLAPGRYARLSVADNGVGMSEDVLDRLFEPFFTTKERGKGTGLGLAMVYGTVVQCGGQISVESAPGRGTVFNMYFPETDEDVRRREAPEAAIPRGNETVLLVEDAIEVREALVTMLDGLGYHVLPANDAESALGAARAHHGPIHLLLTDIVLPGANGPELARRLLEIRPEAAVLFTSGYLDGATPQQDVPSGAALLTKPFSLETLAAAVRRVLDSARPSRTGLHQS